MRLLLAALLAVIVTGTATADTTGGIRGRVLDIYAGYPAIPHATVLVESSQAVQQAKADEHGFFVMLSLPPGYYQISVTDDGYTSPVRSVCVSAGSIEDVRLFASRVKGLMWRPAYWQPNAANPSRTSDVYSFVGDSLRPC